MTTLLTKTKRDFTEAPLSTPWRGAGGEDSFIFGILFNF